MFLDPRSKKKKKVGVSCQSSTLSLHLSATATASCTISNAMVRRHGQDKASLSNTTVTKEGSAPTHTHQRHVPEQRVTGSTLSAPGQQHPRAPVLFLMARKIFPKVRAVPHTILQIIDNLLLRSLSRAVTRTILCINEVFHAQDLILQQSPSRDVQRKNRQSPSLNSTTLKSDTFSLDIPCDSRVIVTCH